MKAACIRWLKAKKRNTARTILLTTNVGFPMWLFCAQVTSMSRKMCTPCLAWSRWAWSGVGSANLLGCVGLHHVLLVVRAAPPSVTHMVSPNENYMRGHTDLPHGRFCDLRKNARQVERREASVTSADAGVKLLSKMARNWTTIRADSTKVPEPLVVTVGSHTRNGEGGTTLGRRHWWGRELRSSRVQRDNLKVPCSRQRTTNKRTKTRRSASNWAVPTRP